MLVTFQLCTAATITAYGIIHDQWLMSVSHEHFTAYHDNIIGIDAPRLNAAALAFFATLGPGLLLGFLLWAAARWGDDRERRPYPGVWRKLAALLVCVEATAIAAGCLSRWQFESHGANGLLLPSWCFLEMKMDLVVAQTIQLFTYAAAALGSLVLLWVVWFGRKPTAR